MSSPAPANTSTSVALLATIGAIAVAATDRRATLESIAAACVPSLADAALLIDAIAEDTEPHLVAGELAASDVPTVAAEAVGAKDVAAVTPTAVDAVGLIVPVPGAAVVLVRRGRQSPFSDEEVELGRAVAAIARPALQRLRLTTGSRGHASLSGDTFAAAFDLSPLVLTITDAATGQLVEVNAAFCRATGLTREQAIGRSPVELGLWMEPKERERGLQDLRAGRPLRDREAKFITDSGVIDCLISASVVKIDGRTRVLSAIKDVTVLKRANELLTRYRLLAEHTHDILLFMRSDGVIVEANAAAERAYGYAAAELAGKSIVELRAPDSLSEFNDQFARALNLGISFETLHRRRDGTTFPVQVESQSGWVGNEQLVLSVIRDITERKRAEEALRASEQRLRLAIEAARLTMWEVDPTGSLPADENGAQTEQSPALESVLCGVHPDDRAAVELAASEALSTGGEFAVEFRRLEPNGEIRWASARGRALPTRAGRGSRLVGVSYDVTAQKTASESLAASEARFRALAEAMPQLVWIIDEEERVEYLNLQWQHYSGRPIGELLDNGWSSLVHPEDLAHALAIWSDASEGRRANYDVELRLRRFDGEYRWFTSRAQPAIDERTGRVSWFGSSTDINDLKQAEIRRGAVIDSLAHDLKNPLAAIKAQAQMLKRRIERDRDYVPSAQLDMLASTASRMAGLIDEMSDAAHLAAGSEIELNLQPIDLVELVQNTVTTYEKLSPIHTLAFRSEPAHLGGNWDPVRLERVLGNLIGNAVKYSPGGGTIQIELSVLVRDGKRWAQIAVRDGGIGIPDADLPHIFDRHRRGTNVGRIVGTGLGLAGVSDIVRLHGGSISVESRVGTGSTFTIRLPLDAPESATTDH